jgi:hypothetical protein
MILAYYAGHSNCPGSGSITCHPSDSVVGTRGDTFSIRRLSVNSHSTCEYDFSMNYIRRTSIPNNGYVLRVQVVDPFSHALATCTSPSTSDSGSTSGTAVVVSQPVGTPSNYCTFDICPASWFRSDIVAGASDVEVDIAN